MAVKAKWRIEETLDYVNGIALNNLSFAAEKIAERARANCPPGAIARPVAKKGKDAGKAWTARIPGSLRDSIRVVTRQDKNNVRVIAGNRQAQYTIRGRTPAFYAHMVEMGIAGKHRYAMSTEGDRLYLDAEQTKAYRRLGIATKSKYGGRQKFAHLGSGISRYKGFLRRALQAERANLSRYVQDGFKKGLQPAYYTAGKASKTHIPLPA